MVVTVVRDDERIPQVKVTPLGAGREVGRSCHIVEFEGKTVMLDCGIHPGHTGIDALPFFDEVDVSKIDLVLITHFHLDHAAGLPYFLSHTDYKGKVFMTHPTRAVYEHLLTDLVRVTKSDQRAHAIYSEKDVIDSRDKIFCINFNSTMEENGITFTAYNAGHVLGAAMFELEISGVRILYTGDYNREEDNHLMSAVVPAKPPHLLIVESTFGVQNHHSRMDREAEFAKEVESVVSRGGRCLLPVFAVGRSQELMLILEKIWDRSPHLRSVPIYYSSALISLCLKFYSKFSTFLNTNIQQSFTTRNPFDFRYIKSLNDQQMYLDDRKACVVLAVPGMLQSGQSRDLLEQWCTNPLNGLVLCGYSVEGSMARHMQGAAGKEMTTLDGRKKKVKCTVKYVSFAAHADFEMTRDFVEQLKPLHVVLVHGQPSAVSKLGKELTTRYGPKDDQAQAAGSSNSNKDHGVQVWTPENCETVSLPIRASRKIRALGTAALLAKSSLASRIATVTSSTHTHVPSDPVKGGSAGVPGEQFVGVVVKQPDQFVVMEPQDLPNFTQLSVASLAQRVRVPFVAQYSVALTYLSQVFPNLKDLPRTLNSGSSSGPGGAGKAEGEDDEEPALEDIPTDPNSALPSGASTGTLVQGVVRVCYMGSRGEIWVTWTSGVVADVVADSVVSLLMRVQVSPSLALSSMAPCDGHEGDSAIKVDDEDAGGESDVGGEPSEKRIPSPATAGDEESEDKKMTSSPETAGGEEPEMMGEENEGKGGENNKKKSSVSPPVVPAPTEPVRGLPEIPRSHTLHGMVQYIKGRGRVLEMAHFESLDAYNEWLCSEEGQAPGARPGNFVLSANAALLPASGVFCFTATTAPLDLGSKEFKPRIGNLLVHVPPTGCGCLNVVSEPTPSEYGRDLTRWGAAYLTASTVRVTPTHTCDKCAHIM